jgi:plastocyanin
MNRHAVVLPISLLVLVSLCGCAANSRGAARDPEPAAVVVMGFHHFEPASVRVRAGQAVRWDNKSLIWHTVTDDPSLAKEANHAAVPPGADAFDSGKVKPGQSYSRTFAVPGTYRYFCRPHENHGMVGQIEVEPAPAAD